MKRKKKIQNLRSKLKKIYNLYSAKHEQVIFLQKRVDELEKENKKLKSEIRGTFGASAKILYLSMQKEVVK